MKYFIYARKSTESEDRQMLSIEAQLAELRQFAAKEKLEITASFEEAKTAKEPGRTKFAEMLDRLKDGEADGILAWHPDRLARNPIDGGQIVYLVDIGKIKSLKFPSFWFEDTPQGKFMLNIAFGQSKYYIDNLSENVKRGLRQKLRRGDYPSWAPVGYLNNPKDRSIDIDEKKHKLVKRIFDMYSSGRYTIIDMRNISEKIGLVSQRRKILSNSMMQRILKNPFYYGVFKFKGEIYEGNHEPIISKRLYDKAQDILKKRGRSHEKKGHYYTFAQGLFQCGSCGCSITAEKQKGHIYYRCTKKKGTCTEKYLREEEFSQQIIDFLHSISIPDDWPEKMFAEMDREAEETKEKSQEKINTLKEQVSGLESKLDKLLDLHIEDSIEKDDYLKKKSSLLSKKIDIEEKIKQILAKGNDWLEPMKDFIFSLIKAKKIATNGDTSEFPTFLKIACSNFILKGKKLLIQPKNLFEISARNAPDTGWRGFYQKIRTELNN